MLKKFSLIFHDFNATHLYIYILGMLHLSDNFLKVSQNSFACNNMADCVRYRP